MGKRSIFGRLRAFVDTGHLDQAARLIRMKEEQESDLNARYHCAECGKDDLDHYMVTNEVWQAAGMAEGRGGFLHLVCLERRLGRPLSLGDFPDLTINNAVRYGL